MEDFFVAFLLPVCIVVVLPVAIVLIISFNTKAKYEKKFSFLEKCVENGVEINPDLIVDQGKKALSSKATLKTMLLNRLAGGVSFLLIGIGLFISSVTFYTKDLFLPGIALIAVGIGLLIWYFIGKKMLAEDIKDEKEALAQHENRLSK